jgi:hypothetical protein
MQKYPVRESSASGHVDPNPNSRNEDDGKWDEFREEHLVDEGIKSTREQRGGSTVDMRSICTFPVREENAEPD